MGVCAGSGGFGSGLGGRRDPAEDASRYRAAGKTCSRRTCPTRFTPRACGGSPTACSRRPRTSASGPRRTTRTSSSTWSSRTTEGTNSGVIVYASDTKDWIPNSVEVQIADDFSEKWAKQPRDLAVRGHLRPPGRREERGQEARRVEPHDGHLQGQDDLRRAQRRAGDRDGHEQVDLGEEEPRRQRDSRLAEQADGRIADQGPHRPARQARRRADLLPQHQDQRDGRSSPHGVCRCESLLLGGRCSTIDVA